MELFPGSPCWTGLWSSFLIGNFLSIVLFCIFFCLVSVEKVQLEIDAVIGQCRQPTVEDKEHMPYTSAVLSEVLRMGNIVPLGVPRMSTSDTTLAGFHLPKVCPGQQPPPRPASMGSSRPQSQISPGGTSLQDLTEISQLCRKQELS